jgi:hypothetical protein
MILGSAIIAGSMLAAVNPALAYEHEDRPAYQDNGPVDMPSDAELAHFRRDHQDNQERGRDRDGYAPAPAARVSVGGIVATVITAVLGGAVGQDEPSRYGEDHRGGYYGEGHHSAEWRYYARRAR